MSRTADRQINFADWELLRQGLRLEPLLQAISDFLDDQKVVIEQVRCDLARGLKRNKNFTPVMMRLQMLMPVSAKCSWKRRTSSGVAVSGDRFRNAANRLQL